MSPECQNCGSKVTQRYVDVFAPPRLEGARCCPHCPDLTRDKLGEPRASRAGLTGSEVGR